MPRDFKARPTVNGLPPENMYNEGTITFDNDTSPTLYPWGLSVEEVSTTDGFPINGMLFTNKATSDTLLNAWQLLCTYGLGDSVTPPTLYMRTSTTVGWSPWERIASEIDLDASNIFIGIPDVSSTTVEGAIEELATEKANLEVFPVGYVYISVDSTNPGTVLGYGTWSQIAQGRMLVGQNDSDADFNVAEETGGSKTQFFTTDIPSFDSGGPSALANDRQSGSQPRVGNNHTHTVNPPATASDTKSIMNPYFVVYMWKRTA